MPTCEKCNGEIVILKETDFGDPIDFENTPWEQYLCEDCYDRIWKQLKDDLCPQCRNQPCMKGRDCWINPWPYQPWIEHHDHHHHVYPQSITITPNKTEQAYDILKALVKEGVIPEPKSFKRFTEIMDKIKKVL